MYTHIHEGEVKEVKQKPNIKSQPIYSRIVSVSRSFSADLEASALPHFVSHFLLVATDVPPG